MSRMGKKPVVIPEGVDVTIDGNVMKVKGKLGELSMTLNDEVSTKKVENEIIITPLSNSKFSRAMWGTTRSMVVNLVKGVTEGFKIDLEINGVGYRAAVQGKEIVLNLGYSHEIRHTIPEGVKASSEKPTALTLEGIDKQLIGELAANIRKYRAPEPYKGKGIKYAGEYILRKEGKKK